MPLTVLVNAGPWLAVPPAGYGGIENVVATLVPELRARGVRVLLSTVGDSTLPVDLHDSAFATGQFAHLASPYNSVMGIAHAHMQSVLALLRRHPEVDLVHDHLEVVGPAVLAALGPTAPPVLQTLHWDLRKHPDFYGAFDGGGRVHFACVSETQRALAPAALREQVVGVVPLATPMPPAEQVERGNHVLVLGRIARIKGTAVAARVCRRVGQPVVLAGPVGGFDDPAALDQALAEPGHPAHTSADVRYYLDEVRPHEDGLVVRWIGSVAGQQKHQLLSTARALLTPVAWEEPGGTAVVEALSASTPVVAFRRGVLPSLVEHGVTGFLADQEQELPGLLVRLDEIDPTMCRQVAEERFSPAVMAEGYLRLYDEVLSRSARPRPAGLLGDAAVSR